MTDTRVYPSRPDSALDARALDLGSEEVEQLWSCHNIELRDLLARLWPSWGFCARHGLGLGIVEVEADLQGGPFLTAILYEHLAGGAAKLANARLPRTSRWLRQCLTARADCFICGRLAPSTSADWKTLAGQINERRLIRARLDEARQVWLHQACPLCVTGGGGLACRPHLLAGATQEELGPALTALCRRLRRLIGSMTAAKTETDILDRLAWLEALGWFGSWGHPQRLMFDTAARHER